MRVKISDGYEAMNDRKCYLFINDITDRSELTLLSVTYL